jgi:predicted CopG family antitoxin
MAKTLRLSDEAYEALASLKRPDETFTDLVQRLVAEHQARKDIRRSAGSWPMSREEERRLLKGIHAERDGSGDGRPFA